MGKILSLEFQDQSTIRVLWTARLLERFSLLHNDSEQVNIVNFYLAVVFGKVVGKIKYRIQSKLKKFLSVSEQLKIVIFKNSDGGGWTLMSHDTGSLMANKTHTDYVNGFGTWEDVIGWLGLDLIHGLTNLHNTR